MAGWSRKKNSDKYDYQTGYASLSKQHPEKKSKREGEDYYQVAVPNLQSFINLVAVGRKLNFMVKNSDY